MGRSPSRAFSRANGATPLRQLFDRVYPILVRFIYSRVWDVDQAEDIAQEAFVRLLDERPDNPEAWLFTVAGNLAKNAMRGEHRRTQRLSLIASAAADRVGSGADRLTLQHEAASQIGSALDTLSDRDRTLLLLHYYGLAYNELAEIIGVRVSSVAPLLARAPATAQIDHRWRIPGQERAWRKNIGILALTSCRRWTIAKARSGGASARASICSSANIVGTGTPPSAGMPYAPRCGSPKT